MPKKLRSGGQGAHPIRLQRDEKKAFGQKLHDVKPSDLFLPSVAQPENGVKSLDFLSGGYYNKFVSEQMR